MFENYFTRRKFLKISKLSFVFLLSACSNISNKIRISFQSSFFLNSLKDILPSNWEKNNLNFEKIKLEKVNQKLRDSDFIIVNDGWVNSLNFDEFENLNNQTLIDKLDQRAIDFLNTFDNDLRNKLFPIGVLPYAVIIKNNNDLINLAKKSWDFLLSEDLRGKIIFPNSPRIIMSIANKIDADNSLAKLKKQVLVFEDKNAFNWLINSNSAIAIVPYNLCYKYLKIDSRLSIVFPDQGVPLMWNFILNKSKIKEEILIGWIMSLEKKSNIDKLSIEGWYLPFNNEYVESKYKKVDKSLNNIFRPSEICWQNSWSFPHLKSKQKINLKRFWNESSFP